MKRLKRLRGLVMLIALLAIAVSTWAATITVPDDYPTIQEAIDAAEPGDTVYVKAGVYTENLTIDKPLHLVGEDRAKVTIRSPYLLEADVIRAKLDTGVISIEGLTVTEGNAGIAVRVRAGAEITLTRLTAIKNTFGIIAGGNGEVIIAETYLIDNEAFGLQLETQKSQVIQNEILGCGTGILLFGTKEIDLCENLIGLCKGGILTYTIPCGFPEHRALKGR